MALTMTDLFAGAGGSSTGAVQVPGVEVKIAANHWQLAVDVHNENHPGADHASVDLHEEDPRYFPRTDILWASPECTKWSEPAGTFTASGTHHGLVMRHNIGGAEMVTPTTEYLRTLTTAGHQSLIQHPTIRARREHPTPDALRAAERIVSECLFRMLTHGEIAAGMAFPGDYLWQPTRTTKRISSRDLVKMAGNAVTPPASRDLLAVVAVDCFAMGA